MTQARNLLPAQALKALLTALAMSLLLAGCAIPAQLSRSEQKTLAGRTYVVVGASSGFGRGVAEQLGRAHANVVLAARRAELLEEIAGEIRTSGGQALAVPTDVGDPAQVEALRAAAVDRFGAIDVWMNIAGAGVNGRFWDTPVEDYSKVIDTNLKGVVYGSHTALRQFIAQGRGVLVNMSSVEGEVPIAYHAVYAATKAGVLSLGRSTNQELRHAGLDRTIKVATVMPWANDTPFFQHIGNYTGHEDRMILMDDPQKVVDALLWVSLHPVEELPVGWKAKAADTAHHLLPDLTERIAANIHRSEIAKGSPRAPGPGGIHQPMQQGRGVEGGVRARMKAEDEARKKGKERTDEPSP